MLVHTVLQVILNKCYTSVALHLFDELNSADSVLQMLLFCTVELNMFVHINQACMGLDVCYNTLIKLTLSKL